MHSAPSIATAEGVARRFDMDQVIIVCWGGNQMHVTTYGRTLKDCDQAAQGGDFVKKALGWPESLKVMPDRVKELQDRITDLEAEIRALKAMPEGDLE